MGIINQKEAADVVACLESAQQPDGVVTKLLFIPKDASYVLGKNSWGKINAQFMHCSLLFDRCDSCWSTKRNVRIHLLVSFEP